MIIRSGQVVDDPYCVIYDLSVLDTEMIGDAEFERIMDMLLGAAKDEHWKVVELIARWLVGVAEDNQR